MELQKAIELLRLAVKNNGTNDTKHIDLTLIPAKDLPTYEKALIVAKIAIIEGKMTQDEFMSKVHLNG